MLFQAADICVVDQPLIRHSRRERKRDSPSHHTGLRFRENAGRMAVVQLNRGTGETTGPTSRLRLANLRAGNRQPAASGPKTATIIPKGTKTDCGFACPSVDRGAGQHSTMATPRATHLIRVVRQRLTSMTLAHSACSDRLLVPMANRSIGRKSIATAAKRAFSFFFFYRCTNG